MKDGTATHFTSGFCAATLAIVSVCISVGCDVKASEQGRWSRGARRLIPAAPLQPVRLRQVARHVGQVERGRHECYPHVHRQGGMAVLLQGRGACVDPAAAYDYREWNASQFLHRDP